MSVPFSAQNNNKAARLYMPPPMLSPALRTEPPLICYDIVSDLVSCRLWLSPIISWYFGPMSRQDATEVLMSERERGVFLVRDSNSIAGDYVLCVREDTKVSNYIINKIQQQEQIFYRIGDQLFENLPKLLTFYTLHYLDTTPLRRPAPKKSEKVIGRFDFEGSDQDDLPFRRGEILTVIRKDEDQWWTARNQQGQIGQIPVPYVQRGRIKVSYDPCRGSAGWGPFTKPSRQRNAPDTGRPSEPTSLTRVQRISVRADVPFLRISWDKIWTN
ncbi:PREDICTED: adapter molecule Crk isoform X7 [Rhagoletis zephyria]|uniref:adapter molecule Crk isoform X7 n=1 Tax=Rhagoletis zephyria TaxID=28612 RepID=UPI0008116BE2|nr:PREDICTED: adapter molecule Crk isoform X7 [Rhagoletis zephyria]